jgi:N2-acetyl-L-2,4-diaminobutanoate deacetylase
MASSTAGWRRTTASTSVIFSARPVPSPGLSTIHPIVYNPSPVEGSPVHCTIDLDGPGEQVGRLEVPRSTNTSGWSHQFVPIVSIRGGDGPTAVVFGGVHGDEPEGQVAALRLARETEPGDLPGRLIVVPCASPEASQAYTRLWPSGANLNRSFPGSPDGPPDQQLADFITRFLFPRADVVVDMHSGGRGSICPPWSEMHMVDDAEQRKQMVEGMLAWNTDFHFVYIDVAGSGLLVGEAERQGKIVVSTELGGGGQVTAATHRVAQSGLVNVLRHFGVLAGKAVSRAQLGLGEPVIARATEEECYTFAPESGLWETFVDVTERVARGQALGQLHFIERPERDPVVVTAGMDGVVCSIRAIATTTQGDKLAVVGREVKAEELL